MIDDDLFAPAPGWRRALPRLGLDEDSSLPLAHLAARLVAAGERGAAADAYREILSADPHDLDALERLAAVMKRLGRTDEEIELHRRIAAITGDRLGVPPEDRDAVIAFELAAIGVGDPPVAPPGSYLAASFDRMAGYFDGRLRSMLRYRGPEQIHERLARAQAAATAPSRSATPAAARASSVRCSARMGARSRASTSRPRCWTRRASAASTTTSSRPI